MKILFHEDPFSGIPTKNYFNDDGTQYYTAADGDPVRFEYVHTRDRHEEDTRLLGCELVCRGLYGGNHYDKRLNQRFFCLEILLAGNLYVRCGGVTYLAEPGDVAIMPPHQDYEFRPAGGRSVRKIGIILRGRLLDGILAGSGIAQATVFNAGPRFDELLEAVDSLRDGMKCNAADPVIGAAAFRLLAVLEKTQIKERPEQHFDRIRQYVDTHAHDRNVLRDCCEVFGLSPYLLRKDFRSVLHTTPKEYLSALRMNRAAEMLMDGHSIKETAQQCGYDNSLNFSTAFRHWHHVPPGKYRRKHS